VRTSALLGGNSVLFVELYLAIVKLGAVTQVLDGPYSEAVVATRPVKHEQFLGHGAFDAVDAIWFTTAEGALDYVGSPECAEAMRLLIHCADASERFLVRAEVVLE
jgi:hypothetical protein